MDSMIRRYNTERAAFKDAVRALRTNLQFADVDNGIKTIVVTSVMPDEGKSVLSISLAIAMTEIGKRTLLVDADCRRPSLAGCLLQHPSTGLPHVLAGTVSYMDAIVPTTQEGLFFLDSEPLANPVEVLSSNRCTSLIGQLRELFDVIIFDTPPLGFFIDAAVLSSKVDGTILVTSLGVTNKQKVPEVIKQLTKANAHILGIAINNVADHYLKDYYYRRKNKGLPR